MFCLPHFHFDYDFFPHTNTHLTVTSLHCQMKARIKKSQAKETNKKSAKNKVIKIMIRHLHTALSSRESSHIAIDISMKIISMLTIFSLTHTHTHKKAAYKHNKRGDF